MTADQLGPRDLRPCDKCNGPVSPIARTIKSGAFVEDRTATRHYAAMSQMFPGAPGVALAFAEPRFDRTHAIGGLDLLLCQACYLTILAEAGIEENVEPKKETP